MVSQHFLLSFCITIFTATALAKDASADDEMADGRRQLRRSRSQGHTTNVQSAHRRERVVIRIDEQKRGIETHDEDVPDWLSNELNELIFEERLLQFSSDLQFSSRIDTDAGDLSPPPALNPTSVPSLAPSLRPRLSLAPTLQSLDLRLPLTESPSRTPDVIPTVRPVAVPPPVTEPPSRSPSTIPSLEPFDSRLDAVPTQSPTPPLPEVGGRIEKKDHDPDERIADEAGKGKGGKGKGDTRAAKGKSGKGKGSSAKGKGKGGKGKHARH